MARMEADRTWKFPFLSLFFFSSVSKPELASWSCGWSNLENAIPIRWQLSGTVRWFSNIACLPTVCQEIVYLGDSMEKKTVIWAESCGIRYFPGQEVLAIDCQDEVASGQGKGLAEFMSLWVYESLWGQIPEVEQSVEGQRE